MDDSEDNMSAEDIKTLDSPLSLKNKPKKRSLVERELETNLTARVTSPFTGEGASTSRYGRARRIKTITDMTMEKVMKPLRIDTSKCQPQAYKMHASNSPIRKESPKQVVSNAGSIEDQIENIYNENMSLSRFTSDEQAKAQSPAKKYSKVYIRKDLIQKPDTDTVTLIKNMFSPVNKSNTHLNNILERSSEKYLINGHGQPRNGFPNTPSVVKTLDFDGKKKKRDVDDKVVCKNELFEVEAVCEYQVGDLAWARVGTYPFWPCIVTREPFTDMFVKKKLFGRVEHDVIHVTFFGDNGRRGWIVDNMLRKYLGRAEFESAREKFTPEAKKKDQRFYAAHFVSEKKLALWNISVDEAETFMREPKRLRIDILHDMLEKSRITKATPKREKGGKITRTDSDVSLSESLYDTLFSEDDGKVDESSRTKKPRNKSLDVSEVVTACLDNMAAKSGIIQLQRQSHMDRWLQKAKSKTPEKTQPKLQIKSERERRKERTKKKKDTRKPKLRKNESLSFKTNLMPFQNEHDYSSVNYENHDINDSCNINTNFEESGYDDHTVNSGSLEVAVKIECLSNSMENCSQDDIITTVVNDDIVVTDADHISKEVNGDDANDSKKIINNSVQDINASNLKNNINSNENEQNATKLELKLKIKRVSNEGIQTRRSKIKRQSGKEQYYSIIASDPVKKPFLGLVDSKTNVNTMITNRNIQCNNVDDQGNVNNKIINSDQFYSKDRKNEIKEEAPIDREVYKDAHKQCKPKKQRLQSELFPLNVPNPVVVIEPLKIDANPVVVIEPLKMDALEIPILVKTNQNLCALNSKSKNNYTIKTTTENLETPITVDEIDQQTNGKTMYTINKEEDTIKESTEKPEDDITAKEMSSVPNESDKISELIDTVSVTNEVKNNFNDNLVTPKDVALDAEHTDSEFDKDQETTNNEDFSKENYSSERNEIVSKGIGVDDHEVVSSSEVVSQSVQSDNLKPSPLKTATTDTMEPLHANLPLVQENVVLIEPNATNIVIGEETYTFDRTMSQDYDEIDTDKNNEVDNLPTDSSKTEVNSKNCNLLGNAEFIFDNTLSQEYDKVTKEMVDTENLDVAAKPKANLFTQEVNNKACDPFVKIDYTFEKTVSQDYDEINKEVVVTDNADINPRFEDNSSLQEINNEINVCDLPVNNNLQFERTLSPDYDEVNKEIVVIENLKIDVNLEEDLCTKEESSKKKNTETSCDNIEGHGIYFEDKVSDYNSKKKGQTSVEEISIPSSSIEDCPMVSHNEKNILDQALEGNNMKPEIKTVAPNDQELNENIAKIRKSPKLSLNTTKKQTIKKSNIINPSTLTSVSHDNICLETLDKDNVATRNDIKNDIIQSNSDVKHTDLNKLSDIKDSKTSDLQMNGLVQNKERSLNTKFKEEFDSETASIKSEDSLVTTSRRKIRPKEKQDVKKALDDPEFIKYAELHQDALIDEQPELTQDEIVTYLYQTWLYEESNKSDRKKTDDVEQSNLVKGLNQEPAPQPKKYKKKPKVEKESNIDIRDIMPKDKPKRKIAQSKPYYNEDFSDLEEDSDLETFNIFDTDLNEQNENGEQIDEVELYFEKLTKPKPNVFKGLVREKVCEICERTGNLVKCKGCHAMFHVDCEQKEEETTEVLVPIRGRKKRKKKEARGRKPKGYDESLIDSGSQSDERSQDANISEELNMSVEDETESHITVDAENFEALWAIKIKELPLENVEDSFESDQEVQWDAPSGQCEIVDVKQKEKPIDYSDFKCHNCLKYETPICFVCKSNKSPKGLTELRQKCQVAHCHRYYHLECLEYWPQTQFTSWEPSKTNKKVMDYIEALSCPRHVCHTCVSDDPRGCKTRFCGDKLARCVKCPATYHSFTKCLPAGTQILTGSQIICPRHYEHRPGKVPCHVNTGWCFICALGGTLICCEYCPTSFHAECLNIKPPEGSYMCEDCETGRLPLYGEMVWVKLGHYRWWPGIVLHPCEIPDNIMAVKHSPGEFVVRFFGQYDHYWVNRGRVFPFQEGDSGRISSQKSKIDAAFTTAMEHAQRACEILKNVERNEEEEEDIASSLLPPHYVKLRANRPVGSLTARRDDDANSLTQCECDPRQPDPCGPYSHCLNRMLLTECGPLCRAGERCNNRAFERRDYPRLAAYRAPHRGWGLKTLEDLKQGQFVIEYVGELIDEEEFRRRMRRKHEVRDENFYFLTLDKERMIDAGPKGNLARFMNHCCEPNCETQKWTVLGDVRVGLFALRDIPKNSEVTFNYNLECAGIEKKRCLCGAKRCSGYIGAKPKQEEAQPKKIKVPAKRAYRKRQKVDDSPSTSKTKPPIKIKITKPIRPRELTEIEKDLLIIKNATNGMSSDSEGSRLSSVDEKSKDTKAMKRKRVSFSTEEVIANSNAKKVKVDECKTGD